MLIRRRRRKFRAAFLLALGGAGAAGCTLLTSTSDLTGGVPGSDAASGSDHGDGTADGNAGNGDDATGGGNGDAASTRDGDAGLTLPDGATVWSGNGHGYLLVNRAGTNVTWVQAKVAAEDLGGHLATITSQPEEDFVVDLVVKGEPDDFRAVGSGLDVGPFIGAYQPSPDASIEPAGGWAWITGEPWSYTAWHAGQPNNSYGDENYGSFGDSAQPGWNDIQGTSVSTAFVVEFE